ncbi:stress-response A/B barrel domain-containing protein HS1-like [Actinidia eriantha]|uniref:stress-response A/B barrel domain-containing protein HS1-like n=1 Tax=Actinidia eriantha TaxID=165200 RepID=UPI002586B112|nr:stress-response A/B barrel domain-containing protein HS1-like [Actinidia eriantha]
MEATKGGGGGGGVVKHILLAKFKDEIPQDQIDQLIQDYAKLVHLIEPMKAFHWGRDVSIENLHQGFTHVFESTFESVEGIAQYTSHPAHVEYANIFLGVLDKVLVVDYKPMPVQL